VTTVIFSNELCSTFTEMSLWNLLSENISEKFLCTYASW
jgi:hypothetical protein